MSEQHEHEEERAGRLAVERFAEQGRTCWQRAQANRLAVLVDAAAYFRAFKAAALRAQHSILIVGWDIHSRTSLEFPDEADPDLPNELGPFLDHLVTRREGLRVRVLVWDSPLIYSVDREWLPQARFDWFTHPRLCFALDSQHPLGACQHQKIVVIDDCLAFVGGIDLTLGRLDVPEHRPSDPRRHNPDGSIYPPFHDVQLAVDGPAAQALACIARDRWTRATGQRLRSVESAADCWPEGLAVDLQDPEVAIARSYPTWQGRAGVREVEALLLETIRRAKESLYIENQYFTSSSAAQAIKERLGQADCPEIILVLPQEPTGWLEQTAMGRRQRWLLARLREADRFGRFRAYVPVVGEAGDVPVKVHSKVMVIDGQFLRVGSANLNNRSMGFDSECDLAVEGEPGSVTARAITEVRDRLLAEHLDVSPRRLAAEIESSGSLIDAVEALRGSGRSLIPFRDSLPDSIDLVVADSEVFDPPAPATPECIADELVGDNSGRREFRSALFRLAAIILVLLGLAALWHWGPIADLASPSDLKAWSQALRTEWLATVAMLGAYVIGGLVMFPVTVLIAATGLLYGPLAGVLVAWSGSMLSAMAGYGAGVLIGRKTLRQLSGGKLERVSRQIARRGLLSMTIIRMIPIAPFTVVNLAAGASHISFRDFVFGTAIGMAPGIAAITLFSGQLGQVLHSPDTANVAILVGLLLVIVAVATWSWRHFLRRRAESENA
ncbi:MAG: VTT domain-containing protein [Kiloniellales bacterium]